MNLSRLPFRRISHRGWSKYQTTSAYPQRVSSVPLKTKLKQKIDEMEKEGIIIQEANPTDWISSLVAVQTPGKLKVCMDPRDLNRAIKSPKYQMPTVDEVLPKLAKAKVSTV